MSRTAVGQGIDPALAARRGAEPGRAAGAGYGAGFWLIALVFLTGMAVLAVGIGVATHYTSDTTAVTWFTGLVLVLLAAVAVLTVRSDAAPERTRSRG